MTRLPRSLTDWLDGQADGLDSGVVDPGDLLPHLAESGLLVAGVPVEHGGEGDDLVDAIAVLAQIAEHSLTAAFVFWGQRVFIEYLLQSPNTALRDRWLGPLVRGEQAGATGLSNAMKYLSGIESLQLRATLHEGLWRLEGRLPWVTNLRKQGFLVAAAVEDLDSGAPAIFAIPHDAPGLGRSADLKLLALQSSNTAALDLEGVYLDEQWRIHPDARGFCTRARPAFLGLQCGMSIGLARRALAGARAASAGYRPVLETELQWQEQQLTNLWRDLAEGVRDGHFDEWAAPLFEIRIGLAEVVAAALQLELQALGGHAYLRDGGSGFARRWKEAAFIPVITPSIVQLKSELAKYRPARARA
jgi:alkylation response protein AidB-like acyl-CoA dehydrogenase